MVGRKGLVRLIELVIAILLITSVFVVVWRQTKVKTVDSDLSSHARQILEELAFDPALRTEVLGSFSPSSATTLTGGRVYDFVNEKLTDDISFEIRVCDPSDACGSSIYYANVYVAERLISGPIDLSGEGSNTLSTAKLRLFLWRDEQ
jgi:hypothetical protein